MKLDFKKKQSDQPLKVSSSPPMSRFSPFRTVMAKTESFKNLNDITNTGSRMSALMPMIHNIQNNRFSLADIDLIESQYSGRTNELQERIENYQSQIQLLKSEIIEKQQENNILKKINIELANGQTIKSFKDDARLANSLVMQDQYNHSIRQQQNKIVKEVRYGKRNHQFGQNNKSKEIQKTYQALIGIIQRQFSIIIDRNSNQILEHVEGKLSQFTHKTKQQQQQLQSLTNKIQSTKQQFKKYLIQILAKQTQKQKQISLVNNKLQYTLLINKQLQNQIVSQKQEILSKSKQIDQYKYQLQQANKKHLSLNLQFIQVKKSQSNTKIHLNTLLSMIRTSNCKQCRLSKYVQDIQKSLSLCQ